MAQTFISLVNQVCRRLNEVELSTTNFATARGFHAHIKDAVNAAIRHINQTHTEWPFNHKTYDEVLVPGMTRYLFPSDAAVVDMESFRLRADPSVKITTGKALAPIKYDDFLHNYVGQEDDDIGTTGNPPEKVFKTHALEWGVVPVPDNSYTVTYEYFRFPSDLNIHSDLCEIPDRYRHVIVDGATYYAYMFRDNKDAAAVIEKKFLDGLKVMRTQLINTNDIMASTMIVR